MGDVQWHYVWENVVDAYNRASDSVTALTARAVDWFGGTAETGRQVARPGRAGHYTSRLSFEETVTVIDRVNERTVTATASAPTGYGRSRQRGRAKVKTETSSDGSNHTTIKIKIRDRKTQGEGIVTRTEQALGMGATIEHRLTPYERRLFYEELGRTIHGQTPIAEGDVIKVLWEEGFAEDLAEAPNVREATRGFAALGIELGIPKLADPTADPERWIDLPVNGTGAPVRSLGPRDGMVIHSEGDLVRPDPTRSRRAPEESESDTVVAVYDRLRDAPATEEQRDRIARRIRRQERRRLRRLQWNRRHPDNGGHAFDDLEPTGPTLQVEVERQPGLLSSKRSFTVVRANPYDQLTGERVPGIRADLLAAVLNRKGARVGDSVVLPLGANLPGSEFKPILSDDGRDVEPLLQAFLRGDSLTLEQLNFVANDLVAMVGYSYEQLGHRVGKVNLVSEDGQSSIVVTLGKALEWD